MQDSGLKLPSLPLWNKVTVPVGVGPRKDPDTVAVHVVEALAATEDDEQLTEVVLVLEDGELTVNVN